MAKLFTRARKALRAYHVYNQGFHLDGKRARAIFLDREDRLKFTDLLARHLGELPTCDKRGRPYMHLRLQLTLMSYCMMRTHFHLLVWQHDPDGIARLMNSVQASYAKYFKAKYENTSPVFAGPACAKPIETRTYFKWLVGYIHDNHSEGLDYEFSSHRAWVDPNHCPAWLDPTPGLRVFGSVDDYLAYLKLREGKKAADRELGYLRIR